MTLTLGTGPFADEPGGVFNFDLSAAPKHRLFFTDYPRRLRALVGERVVLDTTGARLLYETGVQPVPYVPWDDFDHDLLERTDRTTHCPYKGDASYWTVRAGEHEQKNAVWAYEDPISEAAWLKGYGALYEAKASAWFVEEEPVYGHIRDPFHRIDVHQSSRPVSITVGGHEVARSERPMLLFETGLPTRAYVPRADVAAGVLVPSDKHTVCPYKGQASYWSLQVDGTCIDDAAWSYEAPLPDAIKVQGYLCFLARGVEETLGPPRAQIPVA